MKAKDRLRIAAGAVLMAAVAWLILAAPGFLSDLESVPIAVMATAKR